MSLLHSVPFEFCIVFTCYLGCGTFSVYAAAWRSQGRTTAKLDGLIFHGLMAAYGRFVNLTKSVVTPVQGRVFWGLLVDLEVSKE